MAKRACGKYLGAVLRNNLSGMQRNVTVNTKLYDYDNDKRRNWLT
jgi:hypothetical protein